MGSPPSRPADTDWHELWGDAPCGLMSTRADGTIVSVNRTLCVWLGYDAQQLLGQRRLQDLLTMGCRIFHQTHWLPLLKMQNSVAEVQLELLHAEGHVVPVLVNAVKRERGGQEQHDVAVFVAADRRKYERELLLARRRAEELLESVRTAQRELALAQTRLRVALDAAALLVWDVEPKTQTPRYEPGVQGLLGLPPDATVSAEDFGNRIHAADRAVEASAFAAALKPGGDGKYFAEYRLLGHDGVERVVSSRGRAFVDEHGVLSGFAGVLQDVTKWRRAEEALRQQEQQAQQRAVLAEQLIGIVSHDLRSPLQVVVMGSGLLTSEGLSPLQGRAVMRIQAAAQRCTRLVGDLLDFTQARLGGGLRVNATDIDLHALVGDVVAELRLARPGRMLAHERRGSGSARVDPDRIAQVVTNLATNALTYGSANAPVTITSSTADDQACTLRVHNVGPPIPQDLRPNLFAPLRRGDQQVELGSRSVGLGLYIVQQIVIAHGGEVTVHSSEADGTTFSVSLPGPTGVRCPEGHPAPERSRPSTD